MSEQAAEFDQTAFRQTMGNFATGVVVVTGLLDGEPIGFAAQSLCFVVARSAVEVAFCPQASLSSSWPRIRESGSFGINMLGRGSSRVFAVDMAPVRAR